LEKNQQALCKLLFVILLTFIFMSVEIVGGYLANSIAIMSDAAHLLSDVIGIGFSAVALIIAQRNANHKFSWGYHRAEVFGALLSIFSIWIITVFLIFEAIKRFKTKPEIEGGLMFTISILCLVFNLIQMKILHSGDGHMHGPAHGKCSHDHNHDH
jgi:zinc transporter 2